MAVINIPAPAGSQYAGQMQMDAWAQFGRGIGGYLGQQRQKGFERQDLQHLGNLQALAAGGQPAPLTGFMSDMYRNQAAGQMFQGMMPMTPFQQATLGVQRLKAERISPSEQRAMNQQRLYNLYQQIPTDKRSKEQQAHIDNWEKPSGPISITNILGQPATGAERKEIAETRASIDALDNLRTLFDNVQTKTGPITGRVSPIAGLVGMTTDEQEAFMAATSAFKNSIIKEITGAQMSEVEAKRIMKQVPDITDPPTRWKAKWEQSKKNLEFLQNRRLEILKQSGIRAPGIEQRAVPTKGRTLLADINPNDIANMSLEQLEELDRTGQLTSPVQSPQRQQPKKPTTIPPTTQKKLSSTIANVPMYPYDLDPIYKKAIRNGISMTVLYKEMLKLKDLDLTKAEYLVAYERLAEGVTAEQVVKDFQ